MGVIFANMLGENRGRFALGVALMVSQSFFFNAVLCSYGLVVRRFYDVPARHLPLHLIPFAVGSFFGPRSLGRLYVSSAASR